MAEVTIKSQLEGLYKQVYADKLENLIPEVGILIKRIPFTEGGKLGEAFNQPIVVSDEQGATYAGSDEDAFALEAPEAMTTKNAQVTGSQILMRAAIGYKAAAAAVAGGPKAFESATKLVIRRLLASINKRVEISHLYGGSGLGVADTSVNTDATHTVMTLTVASFAAGIWVGARGAKIDAYREGTSTLINAVGPLTIDKVDISTYKLTVSGAAADITALDSWLSSGNADLFFRGAKGKESLGLDKIITTLGSLFGVDNSVYDLWKGQEFDCSSAALSFDKITQGAVLLQNYGFEGEVLLMVNPTTWQNLNEDEAALRNYDYSYKASKAEKGNMGLRYNIQNVVVEVISHPMVKRGDAFMFSLDKLMRVGAWDVSTKTPGYGDEIFRQLEDNAAFEIRAYTDQALFTDHASHLLKFKNIVNS